MTVDVEGSSGAAALDIGPAATLQTRGIRVDGRVRSVDILENLLSLGRQDAILRATLDAAELRPGERLVDVGCGSGKLAIAAARQLSRAGRGMNGSVIGIDA